jgi:hypothetical protein
LVAIAGWGRDELAVDMAHDNRDQSGRFGHGDPARKGNGILLELVGQDFREHFVGVHGHDVQGADGIEQLHRRGAFDHRALDFLQGKPVFDGEAVLENKSGDLDGRRKECVENY